MSTTNKSTNDNDSVSLKEMILKIREFYQEIIRNWKLIGLICIPFVAYFLYNALTTPPKFNGKLTFMVNEDHGTPIGGAASILSQFVGGKAGSFNLDKILELSKSRNIIRRMLLDSITVNGKTDICGNHLIEIYEYEKKWKGTSMAGFRFTHSNYLEFNTLESTIASSLHRRVLGNDKEPPLFFRSVDNDTGIMTLRAVTRAQDLTIAMLNSIFENLSQFYVDKTIEKQKSTFDLIRAKADSLEIALNKAEFNLAKFKDSNRKLWSNTAAVDESRLNRELQILTILYGEAVKNMEVADFSLKNKTPFIQVIDRPLPPIYGDREAPHIALIIGLITGGILAVAFVVARKIYFDIMKSLE